MRQVEKDVTLYPVHNFAFDVSSIYTGTVRCTIHRNRISPLILPCSRNKVAG